MLGENTQSPSADEDRQSAFVNSMEHHESPWVNNAILDTSTYAPPNTPVSGHLEAPNNFVLPQSQEHLYYLPCGDVTLEPLNNLAYGASPLNPFVHGTGPSMDVTSMMILTNTEPPPLHFNQHGMLIPPMLHPLPPPILSNLEILYDTIGIAPHEIDMKPLTHILRHLDAKGSWSKSELALDARRLSSQQIVRNAMPGVGQIPLRPYQRLLKSAPPPCPIPLDSDHRFDPCGLRAEEWLELDICNAFTYGLWHLELLHFSHRVRFALLRWQFKIWDGSFRTEAEERDGRQPRQMRLTDVNYIFAPGEERAVASSYWDDPSDPAAEEDLTTRFRQILMDWRRMRGRYAWNMPLNIIVRRALAEWQQKWNLANVADLRI